MRILVTGANGFVGKHLINELLKRDIDVIATSVEKSIQNDDVTYIQYDINSNSSGLIGLFQKPDQIIHLAWQGLPNYNESFHVDKNLPINLAFIKTLLNEGLKKVNVIGTCFEYGLQEGALSENMETKPSNPYGIAKDLLRKEIEALKNEFNFDFNWYRLFYVYGEGQNPNSLLSSLDKALENGDKFFNMSKGDQIRDFIKIEDAVEIIAKLSLYENECGIVNCSSGKPITVKELVDNHLKEKSRSIKLNLGYYPYSENEPFAFWGDTTKLNKILGEIS